MAVLVWDDTGKKIYETGVDKGVLYIRDDEGAYSTGYAWNGLTGVTESPSGAETTSLYANNAKYINLVSAEEFGCTIEAYTCPDEFAECDGSAEITDGVAIGQQNRKTFGLCYRTAVGNDIAGDKFGYKLHLIYGCLASPSERSYATINDSPEAMTLSWEAKTTPVPCGPNLKPTATVTIDSTKLSSALKAKLAKLEETLYGTSTTDPQLPLPLEIKAMFEAA